MRAWIRVELPVAIVDKSWIRVLDTPSCYGRAVPPSGRIESPPGFAFTTRLIGQKFRAVCTASYVRHDYPWQHRAYCAIFRDFVSELYLGRRLRDKRVICLTKSRSEFGIVSGFLLF